MILNDESANLQKVKKRYISLTSLEVVEKYRLPRPSELDVGNSIVVKYRVHIIKKGDMLSTLVAGSECDVADWQELAKFNNIKDATRLRIGQHLVIPIKKDQHAILTKTIIYEETQKVAVGDCVHLVTEVEGFKKGESVLSNINEEDKITKSDELLTVTQQGKPKKEFMAVVEEDMENPTKGKAISEEMTVEPPVEEKKDNSEIVTFKIKDEDGKLVTYQIFNKTKKEKKENNTTSSIPKDWKENFEEIEDENVTLKVKVTSPSLPKEKEVESEEVKLQKARSVKISLDELEKKDLDEYLDPDYIERVRDEMNRENSYTGISQEALAIAFGNKDSSTFDNNILPLNPLYSPSAKHMNEVLYGDIHVDNILFDTKVGYPFTRAFKSLGNGLMRFGDETACLVGFRDYQLNTNNNYFQKQAEDRFFGYEELLKNLEENEKFVKISALRYLKYGDTQTTVEGGGQFALNFFVGAVINKGAKFPISLIALSGNGIYGIETINKYTNKLIEHKDEYERREANGTLTKEYLNELFNDVKDK